MDEPFEPKVRSKKGLIPWLAGVSPVAIREWRERQATEGNPGSFEDYFAVHRICLECLGHGAVMVGWSDPVTPVDKHATEEFALEQLPLYDVCPICKGTGKR